METRILLLDTTRRDLSTLLSLLAPLTLALSGVLLGLSWDNPPLLPLLGLYGYCWSIAPTRSQSLLFCFAYYFTSPFGITRGMQVFFEDLSSPAAWAIAALHAFLLALPWAVAHCPDCNRSASVLWRAAIVLFLTLIPPLGIVNWAHPLTCAGALFPGMGWLGLFLTVVLFLALTALPRCTLVQAHTFVIPLIAVLLIHSGYSRNTFVPQVTPTDWIALDTQLGDGPPDNQAHRLRQKKLIQMAKEQFARGTLVVILPENVAGIWTKAAERLWLKELDRYFAQGHLVMVGALLPTTANRYDTGLVIPGRGKVITRVPMPLGAWRPFSRLSANLHLTKTGATRVAAKRVAVSVCYEDVIPWPILWSLFTEPKTQVIISVSNLWWAGDTSIETKQQTAISAWANLFDVPLLKSVNR